MKVLQRPLFDNHYNSFPEKTKPEHSEAGAPILKEGATERVSDMQSAIPAKSEPSEAG
ncbi:MAG: hypothetical protein IKO68_01545 [Oscillospiraceae bacterium]|nr:hypothetical protein [Oscillospiraceae bacterium]